MCIRDSLMATLQRGDNAHSRDEGLIEIYKRQKPGEPPTRESAQSLFNSLFFDAKRYDLMRVGRYKFNKKLSLATRIQGQVTDADIADPRTDVYKRQGSPRTQAPSPAPDGPARRPRPGPGTGAFRAAHAGRVPEGI